MRSLTLLFTLAAIFPAAATSQQADRTEPVVALRDNTPMLHALTNARVVVAPGRTLENATLVIRDGVIEAVGTNVQIPSGARVWDLSGHTLYPGFIDAHADLGIDQVPEEGDPGPIHWNPQVRAYFNAAADFRDDPERRTGLRSQGFGAVLAVPRLGIFRGQAAVVSLGEGDPGDRLIAPEVAQAVSLSRSFQLGGSYPNSPMGAIALIRQTLLDADWYIRAWNAYETSQRALRAPERNQALAALESGVRGSQPFFFEAGEDVEFMRAQRIAEEFSLDLWIRGSGEEYRILDVVRSAGVPLVVPIDFPDPPDVETPEDALDASLAELRHWYLAPENPARLAQAGVEFSITSDELDDPEDFLPKVRQAVRRGLDPDRALAAITTNPARLLGIDVRYGTLEAGKVANLVVARGDLFRESVPVRDVWVDGRRYEVSVPPRVDPRGEWEITSEDDPRLGGRLTLEGSLNRLRGSIEVGGEEVDLSSASARTEAGRLHGAFPGSALGMEGVVRFTASVEGNTAFGWSELPDGTSPSWRAERVETFAAGAPESGAGASLPDLDLPDLRPSMEFGREGIPDQPGHVLVRNATVWTQGPQGRLENADLLVRQGRVLEVGTNLQAPSGAVVIDASGKHVTPGLIDPHLHSGVDGINESGFAIVPEVRIGDVLNHNNLWMYRQLAGGLTTAHVKHGSANPIGGQNIIVKMRWGALPEELKLEGGSRTVKFALGENPKRREDRYPDTRMGTHQIIRDHFLAARDYERAWAEWERTGEGIPPRRDLRMEALVDILNQELLVSSHGYRQDEFLMLIRLAEEFGFRIQTLQHGVEAYKIAPELAESGVAAVVWSDWSSFKLEAYDATTYNARILTEAGVLTSLHSDDSQIASRMNWEAGKTLRTGMGEEEALALVTSAPAQILAIDDRVGSLEPGKDADFVIWNGHPLSQFTRAEQTWVDGRRYFDIEEDQEMRRQVQRERARLIQAILQSN